ncbi:hypothetical protein Tco_1319565 [Tanacetum coccineum]
MPPGGLCMDLLMETELGTDSLKWAFEDSFKGIIGGMEEVVVVYSRGPRLLTDISSTNFTLRLLILLPSLTQKKSKTKVGERGTGETVNVVCNGYGIYFNPVVKGMIFGQASGCGVN